MSKKYSSDVWPVKLLCSWCDTQVGAFPKEDVALDSLIIWCEKCQEWARVDQKLQYEIVEK